MEETYALPEDSLPCTSGVPGIPFYSKFTAAVDAGILSHRGSQFFPTRRTQEWRPHLLSIGWSKYGWLQDKAAAALLHGGEKYRSNSLNRELGTAVGSSPHPWGEEGNPCHDTLAASFAAAPEGREGMENGSRLTGWRGTRL
jgi:hypothetical protein